MSNLHKFGVALSVVFGIGCGGKETATNPVVSTEGPTETPPVVRDSSETLPAEEIPLTPVFRLAFVSGSRGAVDIFLMKTDGSVPTNLTQTLAQYYGLAWSPDGSKLAFMSEDNASGGGGDIFVLDIEGGTRTKLTDQVGYYGGLTWSPDGTRLAFTYQRHIYLMNADGSNMKALTTDPFSSELDSDSSPTWSPDGNRIAFFRITVLDTISLAGGITAIGDVIADIHEVNADGSQLARLTEVPLFGYPSSLSWSPDGSQIAFAQKVGAAFDSDQDIYLLDVRGGMPINLTNSPTSNDGNPVWSPDGSQIAFASYRDAGIYVVTTDGSEPVNLSHNSDDFPKWSSDGKQIAYVHYGSDLDIYSVDVAGGAPVNLTNQSEISIKGVTFFTGYFAWAPN